MNIYIHTIFPEIFDSFLNTSLIKKAQESHKITINLINIRDFCIHKHKQVDDKIYGGGAGMLIKAKPVIDSIENTIKENKLEDFEIVFLTPSEKILDQKICFEYSRKDNIILLAGRYEGIDHRVEQYFQDKYNKFEKISIGKYVLLGGEIPAMVFVESVVRLVKGVISKQESYIKESYSVAKNMENIENPQYTVPGEIYGYKVPEVLLSGNDSKIEKWRNNNQKFMK